MSSTETVKHATRRRCAKAWCEHTVEQQIISFLKQTKKHDKSSHKVIKVGCGQHFPQSVPNGGVFVADHVIRFTACYVDSLQLRVPIRGEIVLF